VGLIAAMADGDEITLDEIVWRTTLTPRGAEALVGVLCGLGLAMRRGDVCALAGAAREYLDRRRPYYLGGVIYGMLHAPLPPQLQKGQAVRRYSTFTGTLRDALRYLRKPNQFGRPEQLRGQHARNLPVNVAAVATGQFHGLRHLVDVGGGSGAFAIPLAVQYPDLQLTLMELPRALRHIPPFLARHGVEKRVALLGANMHQTPWPVSECDGILFGNMLHFCDDDESLTMLRESRRLLSSARGRVFVHELLWNDRREGPLLAALWNFWMTTISSGRQRTVDEIERLLRQAGFETSAVVPTAGGYSLVVGTAV
jgi:ubiquinone/menaquinone biosynthesis C-methylase UbiE